MVPVRPGIHKSAPFYSTQRRLEFSCYQRYNNKLLLVSQSLSLRFTFPLSARVFKLNIFLKSKNLINNIYITNRMCFHCIGAKRSDSFRLCSLLSLFCPSPSSCTPTPVPFPHLFSLWGFREEDCKLPKCLDLHASEIKPRPTHGMGPVLCLKPASDWVRYGIIINLNSKPGFLLLAYKMYDICIFV